MVSTRGLKFKFSEGERVLCYEPDPTKAKVLYDSKVLEVKACKDQRGRKGVEFLIHFQGWNSSWDRCVTEDYVLKDTEENRQLQQDLAHKAQLQLCSNYRRGAYLYRKDRTKRQRKLSDRINDSIERQKRRRRLSTSASTTSNSNASGTSASIESEDGSNSDGEGEDGNEDDRIEEDGSGWERNSSEESSGGEDDGGSDEVINERIPMDLSSGLKCLLEHDNVLITKNNKLLKLPAEPNVVSILEGYVKHCAVNQLCNSHTTSSSRNGHSHRNSYKYMNHNKTQDLDTICRNLNICKEVADGLRVYFDFTLSDLLLYSQEKLQCQKLDEDTSAHVNCNIKQESERCEEESAVSDNIIVEVKNEVLDPTDDNSSEQEKDNDRDKGCYSVASSMSHHSKCVEDTKASSGEQIRKRSLRSSQRTVQDPSLNSIPVSSNGLSAIDTPHSNSLCPKSSLASRSSLDSAPSPSAPSTASQSEATDVTSPRRSAILSQVMTWHLVPSSLHAQRPLPPSLVYGATHLARLFVRLPDLLYTGTMPNRKLQVLTSHLETFMRYLEEHTEWFADHNYVDNPNLPAAS